MKKRDTRQDKKFYKTLEIAIELVSDIAKVVVTFLVFYILFRLSIQLQEYVH